MRSGAVPRPVGGSTPPLIRDGSRTCGEAELLASVICVAARSGSAPRAATRRHALWRLHAAVGTRCCSDPIGEEETPTVATSGKQIARSIVTRQRITEP
jgi:hypothetical protein